MLRHTLFGLLPLLVVACSETVTSTNGSSRPPAVADADAGTTPPPPADPTGWTRTGSLKQARALATATVLADGRVLVTGGEDDDYAMLASAELFDPETGAFTEAAALPSPRDHHTATLLPNGEVLVAGGGAGSSISLPSGEKTTASAVLYDPKTNAWRETGTMHTARAGHRAVLLENGRVFVAGGGSAVGYPCHSSHPDCTVADSIASAEIYDPGTGTWTEAAPLAQARLAFALNVTPAGVVASGGAADDNGLESVEIYDAKADAWRAGPKLKGERLNHATAVLNGKLVVAGGKIANVSPITTVDVLDTSTSRWTTGASLDEPRTGASFLALPSGKGLLVAGNDQTGRTPHLDEAALYDPEADAWTVIQPLAQGRYSQATALLKDGSVLVIGGRTSKGVTTSVERSQP